MSGLSTKESLDAFQERQSSRYVSLRKKIPANQGNRLPDSPETPGEGGKGLVTVAEKLQQPTADRRPIPVAFAGESGRQISNF